MKSTRKTRSVSPAPLQTVSVAVTTTDTQALASLSQAASDTIGRAISASALLRALIRLADRGVVPFGALTTEIESELNAGRKWGHDRKR